MPVYNIEKYLKNCFDSIGRQTFEDYEVIVIDDGSTDGSAAICDKYASIDSRITVKHKANGGVVSARKAAASLVRGDYVISVDGDDFIDDDLLERLHGEIILSEPDYVAYGYREVDENGSVNYERFNNIEKGIYTEDRLCALKDGFMYDKNNPGINGGNLIFSLWTKAIKKEIYVESQMSVDDQVEKGDDLIVNIYALKKANSVSVSEIKGYNYRQQPSSLTHVFNLEDIRKQAVLRDEIIKACEKKDEYNLVSNQASVCIFYTTYERLVRLVNTNTTYREFKNIIIAINEYELFKTLKSVEISLPSFKEKTKIFFIKKKMWHFLYLYIHRQAKKQLEIGKGK